ncbi:hypothetical protein GCM10027059_38380 [Myceligenerans halotolerans]
MLCSFWWVSGSIADDKSHELEGEPVNNDVAVLDRATADLFDLDVQETTVPYIVGNDTTHDGCSKRDCPSVGCSKTCQSCKTCKNC